MATTLTPEDLNAISAAVAVVVRDAVAPLEERLDTLEAGQSALVTRMEAGFAEVRGEMQTHFRLMNERLTRLEERVSVVELKLDHALGWQRGQAERIDALEARVAELEAQVAGLLGSH